MRALLLLAPLLLANTAADQRFDAIWQEEWRWRTAERIADSAPDTVEPHLPDVSAAAHARWRVKWQATLAQVDAIPAGALSPDVEIDRQVYRNQLAGFLADERFREWEKPVNGDSAFWSDLQYAARAQFAKGEPDYRAYLTWLADIPRYFDQQAAAMSAGLARRFVPPRS